MADSKVSENELCNYCKKKSVKKSVQCSNCSKTYHTSCATRVSCCGKKLIEIQNTQEFQDTIEEEDMLSITLKYEEILTENKVLKNTNKNLGDQIIYLKKQIQELQEQNAKYKEETVKIQQNYTNCEQNIDKRIKEFIVNEIENKFCIYNKDLNYIKMKINSLEGINCTENLEKQKKCEKKEADKPTPEKRTLYSSVTKKGKQDSGSKLGKETQLQELENTQRKIMNNIINLQPGISEENKKSDMSENKINETVKHRGETVKRFNHNGPVQQNKMSRGQPKPGTALSKLKVVKKLSWIFLSNFDIEMTPNDILNCIDDKYKDQCECMKLETRMMENVASFKLGVPFYAARELGSLNYWPEGVKVGKYKFPRNREQENFTEVRHVLQKD